MTASNSLPAATVASLAPQPLPPIATLLREFHSGERTPVGLMQQCFETIDRLDPQINALPTRFAREQALALAERAGEAIRNGGPTSCNFDYSGALTEAVVLGVVAYHAGQPIEWDSENLKITNLPEAQHLISKEYRKGWELD